MKILYLGYFSTEKTFSLLESAGLDPSVGRQKLEKSMIDVLLDGTIINRDDIDIVSYLPQNKKIKNTPDGELYEGKYIQYAWTGRNNIFEIIRASKRIGRTVFEWNQKNRESERIILTYAANPILLSHLNMKRLNVRMVTICSEVPEFRNMTEGNRLANWFKKRVFTYYNSHMDGYIFLTKHMNTVCNANKKPWIVIEGMHSLSHFAEKNYAKKDMSTLFYAGGLHIENGIVVLLQAMKYINNVELQLCGVGNALPQIYQHISESNNIHYLGSLSNREVVELEKEADLLINPRKNDFTLTKYSFPSKTFEYFASGTPCLITRLDGIPDEYYDYCYTCDASSPEALAGDIERVLNIPETERHEKAIAAYNFLKNEKSAEVQTKKIVDFLYKVAREP